MPLTLMAAAVLGQYLQQVNMVSVAAEGCSTSSTGEACVCYVVMQYGATLQSHHITVSHYNVDKSV